MNTFPFLPARQLRNDRHASYIIVQMIDDSIGQDTAQERDLETPLLFHIYRHICKDEMM